MKKTLAALIVALLAVLGLAACGSDDSNDSGGSGSASGATTLTVFAAASLTSTFTEIGQQFESAHPGVKVTFNFDGSSTLVSQLENGAPADVFASADTANMDNLTGEGLQGQDPQDFASNTLEIAVPPGNPAGVSSLQDLAKPGLKLVDCAPEVPCGAASATVAQSAGLTLNPVSEEQSVTDVLAKVSSGEADAGLVYVTDVTAAKGSVDGVPFPESKDAVNVYPITTLKDSGQSELAQQFVQYVLSSAGQKVLSQAGFAKP